MPDDRDYTAEDAPLEPQADERRIGDELREFAAKRKMRQERKRRIQSVSNDVNERRLPHAEKPLEYSLGEKDEVRAVVNPVDRDGIQAVHISSTPSGEYDTVLEFEGRGRKLKGVVDLAGADDFDEQQEERKEREREEQAQMSDDDNWNPYMPDSGGEETDKDTSRRETLRADVAMMLQDVGGNRRRDDPYKGYRSPAGPGGTPRQRRERKRSRFTRHMFG